MKLDTTLPSLRRALWLGAMVVAGLSACQGEAPATEASCTPAGSGRGAIATRSE